MIVGSRRIERTRSGDFRLRLPREERELLRTVPAQLRALLDDADDPSLVRLFPPAYREDLDASAEFAGLERGALLDGKRSALRVLEETATAERVSEAELTAWMTAINDLRLVLGTRLDVSEESYGIPVDPTDPRAPEWALYHYLSWLQEQVVDALAAGM
jgi:hypothetical protein